MIPVATFVGAGEGVSLVVVGSTAGFLAGFLRGFFFGFGFVVARARGVIRDEATTVSRPMTLRRLIMSTPRGQRGYLIHRVVAGYLVIR